VQDDEVADQLDLQGGQAVVFVDLQRIEALVREQGQQLGDPAWIRWMLVLSSGSRKPDDRPMATQFLIQACSRRPAWKRRTFGSARGRSVEAGRQAARAVVVADVGAGIDIAVAGAVLQRDAPAPAGLVGGGAGVGRQAVAAGLAGHGHGPVVGQPVAPVLDSPAQGLADQQGAKARAVDEQVGLEGRGRPPGSPTG
jgi:hypothetical protein